MRTKLDLPNTRGKIREERAHTQTALDALRKQRTVTSPDPTEDEPTYFDCWEDNLTKCLNRLPAIKGPTPNHPHTVEDILEIMVPNHLYYMLDDFQKFQQEPW